MRGSIRWGVGGGLVVAAAGAICALSAPAQLPEPNLLPRGVLQPEVELPPPPRPVEDPELLPAQFTAPGAVPPATPLARAVADPPTPVVRIQVRVPADSPPGDDLKYVITVQNTSAADAHAVAVRNPIPEGVEFVKAEPDIDQAKSQRSEKGGWKELQWAFGTLPAGKSKTIELTLKPKAGATEVRNLAYVRFEHGQVVTTRVNKPAVRVTKVAPKQAVRDETFAVRIAVDNTGRVPAEKLRVVENLPASAEFEPVTKGARRTEKADRRDAVPGAAAVAEGQQWVWEIPRLMPGERRVIEYRLTPREGKNVFALTHLGGEKEVADKAESNTAVLVPGLSVKVTGPPPTAPVSPGEAAKYEITVRNTGTLPATNVRVTGTLPPDCRPTMKTEGGQLLRDAIQWVIPRLDPGDAQAFRFGVKASTTGRRVVVASAADSRGQRAADEVATVFQGTAALVWETEPRPAALAVGRQGTFTVRVRNVGGEQARNVRVEVELPDAVNVVQTTPSVRPAGGRLAFGPETVAANGEATYTITYEARQPAQAWFKLRMTADSLGDRPMTTEKAVEITGGGK